MSTRRAIFLWLLVVAALLATSCQAAKYRVTSQVFMKFRHGKQPLGKVVFGLFGEDAPKTVENFRELCLKGIGGRTYAGTRIHRIIERFLIQGGDMVSGDGTGAVSIYGEHFEDENMSINHTGPGFLGMANRGPDTNGCQFYVTCMSTPWLNGKHTIFGKVVEEQAIIHAIEKVKTDSDDRPLEPVVITECGDEPLTAPFTISDDPYDLAAWLRASAVPLGFSFLILGFFQYMLWTLNRLEKKRD